MNKNERQTKDYLATRRVCRTLLEAILLIAATGCGTLLADEAAGLVVNPGMTVMADNQGVQAPGYRFDHKCAKPSAWQAEWIWSTNEATEAAWLRKEVTLADAPQKVAAWLTADVKYQLYINGRLVARGPVDQGGDFAGGGTRRWFYDYRDLTSFFSQGKNVIAAKVYRKGTFGSVVSRGKPGFLFEAEITSPGKDKLTVKSDTTWRALAVPVIQSQLVPEFNDATWSVATVVPDVWAPLVASEIPPLMEARYPVARIEGLPDNKTFTNDGSFKVVFERVLSGFPNLKVKGGKGAQISIQSHNAMTLTLSGGEQTIEYPFMDEIVPSYTVGVSNVTEPLEIQDAGAVFTSQPVEYKGAFESSDDGLNRIWKVSRWAVQICLQTHHLDSPNHQEPISDPGDYVIESMVNHYAFAQPWLARQDIRKFAWVLKDENYHNFHTSYSLAWLQLLMDYYDYTGDRSLVVEMAPYVHELLDTYASWRGKNGIISEAPNYMFMDWVKIGGFEVHHPPAVIGQGYLTAFYYHGLEMAARVATMTGDEARVQKYAHLREEIATAFNRELWVADKGLYRDGKPFQTSVPPGEWLPADKDIETFSPHVNVLAVLYDLAPKAQQAAIVEKVLSEKPLNTQPWFMHWVFQAIDHAGLFDKYGTDQMRRWEIVPETQSFREMWNGGDLSHGWCSTPLVQLSARVLGVTPAAPGFETIAIRPELCDLTWAKGSVPTPHGEVVVAWTLDNNRLQLDVTIPPSADAEVALPVSRFEQPSCSLNGQKCGPTVHISSGFHHFEVAGKLDHSPKIVEAQVSSYPEADVVKNDLVHFYLARAEDHCSHTGGGTDTSALFNGTTRNGAGSEDTLDDGRTFRGYGSGDWLVLWLKQPCDLTEIRTFAGHADARASQNYTVLVAYAAAPDDFVKLTTGSKTSEGGATELRLPVKASVVVAVRFEFKSGAENFNVYREINLLGTASSKL
jgi:hypothetical protein